jgi:hypothetical protein
MVQIGKKRELCFRYFVRRSGIELLLNRKAAKPFARVSCVDCPLGEAQIYFVVQARIRIAARSSKYSCPSARSNPIAAGARRRTDFASE